MGHRSAANAATPRSGSHLRKAQREEPLLNLLHRQRVATLLRLATCLSHWRQRLDSSDPTLRGLLFKPFLRMWCSIGEQAPLVMAGANGGSPYLCFRKCHTEGNEAAELWLGPFLPWQAAAGRLATIA